MTPADQHALREALAREFHEVISGFYNNQGWHLAAFEEEGGAWWRRADILIAAPLAPYLAAEAENTRLKEMVEAMGAALKPFASSVTWGGWLSWLINGAPSRDQGKAAAKQLVHWRVAVDVVLATIPPKENP